MSDIDEDLLNRHRWVRVMADYSCDGVWDIEGNLCGVEDLPISPALVERLGRWQAHYEAIEDAVDEENRLHRESDWTNFSAEGLAIARAVKAVTGPRPGFWLRAPLFLQQRIDARTLKTHGFCRRRRGEARIFSVLFLSQGGERGDRFAEDCVLSQRHRSYTPPPAGRSPVRHATSYAHDSILGTAPVTAARMKHRWTS